MAYIGKILTRSPFFITASGVGILSKAELSVTIWSGDSTSKPATPNYIITKNALTSTSDIIIFEVSELIRDYFSHNRDAYTDVSSTFIDALWVETDLVITPASGSATTVNSLYIAFDGYDVFENGVNPQGSINGFDELNLPTGYNKRVPIYANSDGIDKVEWLKNGVVVVTNDLTTNVSSTLSYDKLVYITVPDDVDTLKMYKSLVLQESIPINIIDECKYRPKEVKFYDINGFLQVFYMFKKSIESLKIKKDNYNSIIGSISSGNYTYNAKNHQFKTYNITSKKSIALNTGYINEINNTIIEQILMSEFVWIDNKPVNVKSESLTYMTSVNDKLINYTIEFDYANNLINNVY